MSLHKMTFTALATLLIAASPALAQSGSSEQQPQSGQPHAQGQASGQSDQGRQYSEGSRECLDNLEQVQQEWANFQEQATASAAGQGGFRELRRAAVVFAENDNPDGCSMIVSEMRDMLEQRRERFEEQQAAQTAEGTDMTEVGMTEREMYSEATPVEEMQGMLRADDIIGADIRSTAGEWLGEAESMVLNPTEAQIDYLLVARGGFLGMGEDMIPVRWNDLRMTSRDGELVLNMSESEFAEAPSVAASDLEMETDASWVTEVDQWWDEHIAQEVESGERAN